METLVELLDHLYITVEDMGTKCQWIMLLLGVIRSSEGPQRLSDWYWELLVELMISEPKLPKFGDTDTLKIASSLSDAQEWGKLECWIAIIWMFSQPGEVLEEETSSGSAGVTEEDLERSTQLLLFDPRLGATRMLGGWMEQWSKRCKEDIPEPLQQILTGAHESAQPQSVT